MRPRTLGREWIRPWPGARNNGCLPAVHMVSFDSRRFAEQDAGDAARYGMGWPPSVARSVPRRQADFFFGRWAARAALKSIGAAQLPVAIGPAREPVWPVGVAGSISHIDGLAAAAVCTAPHLAAIGLDIEQVAIGEAQEALRNLVLTSRELDLLRALNGEHLDRWVTLAFSAKESFFKAAYCFANDIFGFEAVRVVDADPFAQSLSLEVVDGLGGLLTIGSLWRADFDLLAGGSALITGVLLPANPAHGR